MSGFYIFDTEGDGFVDEMTKFHCLVFKKFKKKEIYIFIDEDADSFLNIKKDYESREDYKIKVVGFSLFAEWLRENASAIACHNLFGYDLPAFNKIFGMDFSMHPEQLNGTTMRLIDTLSMSRCLYPDRPLPSKCPAKVFNPVTGKMDTVGSHGLMAWGYRVASMKPEVHDWRDQPLSVYVHRCFEDVIINELTLIALIKESENIAMGNNIPKLGLPSEWKSPLKLNNKSDYLMDKQNIDGILFDREKAEKLLIEIDDFMDNLAEEVEKNLPKRLLPQSARPNFPSEPFKQDGDISSSGYNWLKRLGYEVNDLAFNLVKIPAKPFKQDGSLSVQGEKFCENQGITGSNDEKRQYIINLKKEQSKIKPLKEADIENAKKDLREKRMPDFMVPMEISNQEDIKRFLVESEGWQPTIWNTKDATKDQNKRAYSDDVQTEKILEYIHKSRESPYKRFIYEEMGFNFDRISDDILVDKLKRKARYLVTTPKLKDERGELCPSLELLQGEMAQKIVKWLSARNRRSTIKSKDPKKLTGWLNNPRLNVDSRIGQGNGGITNTNRYKHRTVVNLPKADPSVFLGKEMRSLFIAPEGKKILGYDGSNLEQFVAGSYAWIYDGGDYAKKLEGDSHTTNALAYSEACGREVTRSAGKNVTYAILYGAQAAKIAKMLGISKNAAQAVIDAFWDTNYGLKQLKGALERYWENTGKKYIRGIDGRKIYTRSKHSLVNALFQSCGAILMAISGCFMYDMLKDRDLFSVGVKRLVYMHDEYQYEVPEELIETYTFETKDEAEQFSLDNKLLSNVKKVGEKYVRYYSIVGELGNMSLQKAGKYLKMPLPFRADYDIGDNLAETH